MNRILETIITAVILVVVIAVGVNIGNSRPLDKITDKSFGGNNIVNSQTLIGSSSNNVSLPYEMVLANSTTTNSGQADGGSTLNQLVRTDGIETVTLMIQAIGGTATSTFHLRQMGSYDGTNFFDIATSTDAIVGMNPGAGLRTASSTVISLTPSGFQFDPGTATTSISVPLQTTGYKWTRFIIYGEDVSTDPADGVQAWIEAILVDEY